MDDKELLISIYQNTSTATQSINDLVKKTEDKTFHQLLNAQYKRYDALKAKVEQMAKEKKYELKDNNIFEKMRLWTSIQMGTLTNNSTRHLAELMLIGSVMGTLQCYKDREDYPSADQDTVALLTELERMEEDNFNELKKYLKS